MAKMTFTEWMKAVDVQVAVLCGCSADDLPDYCYADAYEDDATPRQAARAAVRGAR